MDRAKNEKVESLSNIRAEEINGKWTYDCEIILTASYFPDEGFIYDGKEYESNRHGGTAEFSMTKVVGSIDKIDIKGHREWREYRNEYTGEIEAKEVLPAPKEWNSIFGIIYPLNKLLYQYRIDKFHVNGITNVQLLRGDNGLLEMQGWFHYVHDENTLIALDPTNDLYKDTIPTGEKIAEVKMRNNEWVRLFGMVKLTKID